MSKSSLALIKRSLLPLFIFLCTGALFAQVPPGERWYRSNSSGMMLEQVSSRLVAMRNEYSLSVRSAAYREIPQLLRQYYANSYTVELRILYRDAAENRRQWLFRDNRGLVRVTASGNGRLFGGEITAGRGSSGNEEGEAEEPASSGIIELRNAEGAVTREFQYDADLSEWDYRYIFREGVLTMTEIWFKEAPVTEEIPSEIPSEEPAVETEAEDDVDEETGEEETEDEKEEVPAPPPPARPEPPEFVRLYSDRYRYSRSGSLRAIDRTIHATGDVRLSFPRIGPGSSAGEHIINQGAAYTASYFIGDKSPEGITISYDVDNRGRILGEVWKDEEGAVIGQLTNTWSGDRLQSVLWKTPDDERIMEYEYDRSGNRSVERNFRNGVLERAVINQNEMEIEEIYMNGTLILRAYWENGLKVKEERVGGPR